MRISCCYNCVPPKRHPGCHSTCPEYIEEKKQSEKMREAIRQQKEARFDADEVSRRAVKRIKDYSRKRR